MMKKLKQILACFLIFVWALFSFNKINNLHFHRLKDGTIVVHSHPFSPYSHHNHTKKQLEYYSIIHHLTAQKTNSFVFNFEQTSFYIELKKVLNSRLISGIFINDYCHSPPIFRP